MVKQSSRFVISAAMDSKAIMSLYLSAKSETGKAAVVDLYDEIAYGVANHKGWLDVHSQFDIRLNQQQTVLEVREKNNPPGPYGTANVLAIFPAFLHEQGLISTEEMLMFLRDIHNSPAAKSRARD